MINCIIASPKIESMRRAARLIIFLLLNSFSLLSKSQDTVQKIIPGRTNSVEQQKKPYVILISADGFRYDLAEKYHAENLLKLGGDGVSAAYMVASYPSLTFPNHYSIVTGLYPIHHGIVDNNFYDKKKNAFYSLGNRKAVTDSSWYGGDPLWVLAEKQKMIAASFYWVASEAAIEGIRPTYYYTYNESIPIERRIEVVKEWLMMRPETRPHFITFYFPEVDHQEHRYGVGSKEAIDAVHFVDASIGKMVSSIDSLGLPVNFVFVSDHGMINIDTLNTFSLPAAIDTTKFLYTTGMSIVHLYTKNSSDIRPTYEALRQQAHDYDVYLTSETPGHWHYRVKDDYFDRIGDILLVPHMPKSFNILHRRMPIAEHGFDPAFKEMRASFFAWGPAFKQHKKIKGFENVNVYPMIAEILGLKIDSNIDGKAEVLHSILK
jgi:predicted AlkP superfamily pyrophosphatase or phosphodiesterase